ncbi:MAG: hypothetical protein HY966_08425, partial [Ignavibacteriales bacterium]|nr:hypothetical protein [Ignavibacteriales bacterium]
MAIQLCIFEDESVTQLNPLVYVRPVYDLRCGITTLREKIEHGFPKMKPTLLCRSFLADVVRQQNPGSTVNEFKGEEFLFVNGRAILDAQLIKRLGRTTGEVAFVQGGAVVAARVRRASAERLRGKLGQVLCAEDFTGLVPSGIAREEVKTVLLSYPWEFVARNGKQIVSDFSWCVKAATCGVATRGVAKGKKKPPVALPTIHKSVHLLKKKDIHIGEGTVIKPGVVIDAEEGPVFIGKNVKVFPQATIIGPCYIGDNSVIKVGAQIYEDTSIGPMCKVGGEVEAMIMQSHSNKQHAGFIGHAFLGSWVNLGADTNNSDLKNNYGSVKVMVNGKSIDTGSQFVGLTMGDHSKSSINSMFNT